MVHDSVSQSPYLSRVNTETIFCRTSTAGQSEGVSKFVDEAFDAAYDYTLEKGDLKHVRFGRIDYLDVTVITTKWAVWTYVSGVCGYPTTLLSCFSDPPHWLY